MKANVGGRVGFSLRPVLKLCTDCAFKVILLSATMPKDVLEVTCKFMRDPVRILVKKEELTLEGIKQFYVMVEKEVSRNSKSSSFSIFWEVLHC